ncbi:MAG: diacylglycerol kinase family lipid kinase [Bacteroidales bacterium]|nr:diacylglycerol kinase family lipid kinase [Bacteroidales bacterium]
MKRRFLTIANPISGTASKNRLGDFVVRCFNELKMKNELLFTGGGGDARRFAEEAVASGSVDAILVIGGDGTVNEVASALCGSDVRMGIIPSGSGNGLARHLGLPLDPVEAFKVTLNGHSIACDYATANGKPFFCTFGVGFDARVSHAFSKCKRRGKFAYLRVIIHESKSYKPQKYRVSTPDCNFSREALILAVCNSSQYGNNAYIAPHASLTDGLLDITVVNTGNPLDLARNSIELFTGFIKNNRRFETLRATTLTIESEKQMEGHLDGEPVMFPQKIEIECHPKSLNVYCAGEPEFKPILTPITGTLQEIQAALSKQF